MIYKSELFPTAAIGVTYLLKPELTEKIKNTLLNFKWEDTGLQDLFGITGESKFVPINFKDDWALIRKIDDTIGRKYVLK